jgi:hypothetical protein
MKAIQSREKKAVEASLFAPGKALPDTQGLSHPFQRYGRRYQQLASPWRRSSILSSFSPG